uniref:Uncharacterized protein n=1 Tax=Oryzias latipes TaxID=8090 RepID=A0A3B3IA02_ORYLA
VIRRTIDKGQKTRPKNNRWSWGGAVHTNATNTTTDAGRRSVSTVNLSKQTDSIITKRLSSSSATLLHSPDRAISLKRLTGSSSLLMNAFLDKRRGEKNEREAAKERQPMQICRANRIQCERSIRVCQS